MAKIQTSQEIADRIHSLSTQLAALQFHYDQAVSDIIRLPVPASEELTAEQDAAA